MLGQADRNDSGISERLTFRNQVDYGESLRFQVLPHRVGWEVRRWIWHEKASYKSVKT
jgi:hypothetical protein